ncbi:hypothetical protein BK717_14730 [Bacillus thuringiensis serovar malayensis]|nr:hypothetical protein BK717_14730 [Bacillus thuringiensis serovar malayensis]
MRFILFCFIFVPEPLKKDIQELLKVFLRLFYILEKNVRKSHRHEKKTVFDILGVMYDCTLSQSFKVA